MGDSEDTCKLSMLWNWDTVDACFVSEQWHVRTPRQYAGSLIGIFLAVVLLEAVRRLARAYDAFILRRYKARLNTESLIRLPLGPIRAGRAFRPNMLQHLLRSLFHFVQFGAAYILMLAAMSHNGGVILAVLVGALVGFFLFGRDTVPGSSADAIDASSEFSAGMRLEQVKLGRKETA